MPETPPRRWQTPPEIHDPARLRADADRRRAALVVAGCQTYTVGMRGGQAAIVCLCCGLGVPTPTTSRSGTAAFAMRGTGNGGTPCLKDPIPPYAEDAS